MKKFYIEVDCNGGEYVNHTVIECKELDKIGTQTIKADNVIITFDEDILAIDEETSEFNHTNE